MPRRDAETGIHLFRTYARMKLIKQLAKLAAWICVSVLALLGVWLGSALAMMAATPLLAPLALLISSILGIDDPQEQYRILATIKGSGICASLAVTLIGLVRLFRGRRPSAVKAHTTTDPDGETEGPEAQVTPSVPHPAASDARPRPQSRGWTKVALLAVGAAGLTAGVVLMAVLNSVLQSHVPEAVQTVVTTPTHTPTPLPTATAPPMSTSVPELIIYTVQPGDTLSSIAGRFGTTVDAIMDLNGLVSPTIHSGTRLRIPSSRYSIPASPHPTDLPTLAPTATPLPTDATPDDEYIACLGHVADLSEQLNQDLDAAWATGDDRDTFCQSWLSYDLLETAQSAQQVHNACAAPQHSDIIEARGHLDRALEYRVTSIQLVTDWCIGGSIEDIEGVFEQSERYMRLANESIEKATSALQGS
jgi:LysM repeat protein